ncbi:MAG: hypothetical protein KBH93_03090 [Anaerolineae bacterium]|nr:hypothetical protein [Anaerolineae bacterium]
MLERLLTIVLMIVFVASFLTYLAIQVMTDDLLNARFYTRALERNRIYDRIYTDLLADPALRDVTVRLLGNLRIEGYYSQETYSHAVSALRLVLPPDVLRSAADRLFTELTAYLSGERQRLHSNIHLSKAINDPELQQKIIAAAQTIQTELIARARQHRLIGEDELSVPVLTPETLYRQLEDYVRALAEGRLEALPFDITNLSIRGLSEAQKHEIARILLAPAGERVTDATRLQVEAALAADDLAGAIVIASGELLAVQAEEAARNLQSELKTGTISGLDAFARLADKTTNAIIHELNDTRELALFFRDDLMPVILLALILSLSGLAALQGTRTRRAFGLLGLMLLLAGASAVGAWALIAAHVSLPFEEFTDAALNGAELPRSLRIMLTDVLTSLQDGVGDSIRHRAAVALLLGVVLLGAWASPKVAGWLTHLLRPLAARPRLALALAIVSLVGLPILLDWLLTPQRLAGSSVLVCNGHEALCDRRFNEVVFPATHNAMSASNLGWVWPHHDGDLSIQLKAGVRAFLLDTHYGDTQEEIDRYLATFPSATRPLVERIVNAADPQTRDPNNRFVCHNLCALGATPLEAAFADLRAFLDRNWNEVVVLILQDEVSPQDTATAMQDSGLIRYVYTPSPDGEWPTLRAMIEANTRLVVLAEQGGPPPDWYLHLWDYTEETTYNYRRPEDFTCAPNRGDTGKPLFLLNHWIARRAPDRVDAAVVNQYDFLLERALTCAKERGHMPNFVAVDFYALGDLFRVVDTLNGIP